MPPRWHTQESQASHHFSSKKTTPKTCRRGWIWLSPLVSWPPGYRLARGTRHIACLRRLRTCQMLAAAYWPHEVILRGEDCGVVRGSTSRAKVPLEAGTALTVEAAPAVNTKAAATGEEEGSPTCYEVLVYSNTCQRLLCFYTQFYILVAGVPAENSGRLVCGRRSRS